jgi:hypothetical protein
LKEGLRPEWDRPKEAKNVVGCGCVFKKDCTVTFTGFVKRETAEKIKVLYELHQAEFRAFFHHMPAIFLRYESADRCQGCQLFTQCSESS